MMASNDAWKVLLQVELDKNSKKTIVDQLLDFQKGIESIGVKVDIDDKQLGQLKTKLNNLSKTTKIFDTTDGTKKLVKEIEKTEDAMGNVVTVTRTQKKEMTEVTNNYEKQNKYLQKSIDIYDDIEKSVNRIFDVDKDLGGFVDENELNKIMDSFSDISIDIDGMTTDLTKVNKLVSTLNKELDSVEKNAKSMADAIRMAQVKKDYDSQVRSDNVSSDGIYTYTASSIDQQIASREKQAKMFSNALKEQMQLEYKRAELMAKDVEREIKDQEKLEKQIREVNLAKKSAMASINNIKTSQDKYDVVEAKRLVSELEKIPPEAEDAKLRIRELNSEIKEFGVASKTASSTTNSFNDSLKRWASFVGLYEMFQLGKRAVVDMASSVVTLDTELTNLMKVSDITSDKLGKFTDGMFEAAGKLGRTGTELTNAVANFAQAGYSADNGTATQLGEQAILMQNIGDGIDSVDTATEVLISTMKAYNLTANESVKINDILNQVSNTSAVSFSKLADMIGRSSALMSQGNTSIEELAGMATAAFEIIQSSERVSTSLNTISLRIRALKTGVEEVDGEPIAKMGEVLDKFNVKIIDSQGELRDFYDIMQDLAGAYKTMSNADKQLVTQSIGGARNSAVLSALLTNWEAGQLAINEALNSTGSALKENSIFIDSLQGRINLLNSAWQQLATTSINSEFVKSIIDMTTSMIKFVDTCGGVIPLLSTILGLLIAIKAQKIGSFVMDGVGVMIPALKKLVSVIGLVSTGWMSMGGAMTALNISMATLATGGIGLLVVALGALTMAYNAYSQAQEERVSKAKDSANAINDELKSTSQLMTRYKELSVVENKTKEQRQELLDIQEQLSEMHGVEARNLDILNKSYEENAKIIDKAVEAKRRYLEIDNNIISADVDNKLADAMGNLMTGSVYEFTGDNGIGEAFRSLNEELQNAFDVDTSGRGFVLKITPDIDENLALKAMDELLKNMESLGQSKTDEYLKLASMYKELSNAIAEKNDMDKESVRLANETKMMSVANEKGVKDLSKATIEQVGAMEQLYIARAVAEKGQTHAIQAQNEFRVAMAETNPEYAKYIGYTTTTSEEIGTLAEELANVTAELQAQKNETIQQSENYALLIASIEKLNSGQQLSGEEVYRLTSAYKDLTPKINETTGEMYLESEALIKLATKQGEDAQQGIMAQINKTKQVATDTLKRIGLITKEVMAINSLSDAYRMLASNATTTTGGYRPVGIDDQTWSKSANNMSAGINSIIQDLADLYAEAEKTSTGIDKAIDWEEGLKDKKGSKSSISDKFKADLEEIKLIREQIQREIDLIQEKMNLAELTGDTKTFDELANKMTVLKDELRGISEIEISKFNGLAQIYKEEEKLLELESLISEARKQGIIDEISYQEQLIGIIEKRSEIEKRAYDDKLRQLNYEQEYTHEDSQEYANIEQQKLDMALDMQNQYMDKIRQLKESGLSDESEHVRKYIDLYKDMLEEQLNLEKSMAEKRKQLELDRLNDLQKDLGDKQSAMKSYIDMVMQMLRDQYNEEKKMIEDNYKLKQDKLKEELNSYKKIIDAKKKSLEDEANTEDYNDEVAKRQKELADMKANAALLGKDETAKAQYEKLLEEIAQKEKDLAKYQRDHNIKLQQESLDKEYDIYEENINKELDALEQQKDKELEHVQKMLDSEVELRRKAIQLIEKDNDKLYKQLQKWAAETGKKTKDEVENAWLGCTDAINIYNNGQMNVLDTLTKIAEKLKEVKFDIESVSDSHWTDFDNNSSTGNGGSYNKPSGGNNGSSTSARDKKVQEMIELGNQMKGKKKEEVDKLLAQQQKIASEIGAFFENDTWYLMIGGKKVPIRQSIGMRHNGLIGGRVGDGMKANEKLMKLTTDEWVINDKQYKMLNKNIDNLIGGKSNGDITVTFDTLMKVDKIEKDVDVDGLLKKANDMFVKTIKSTFNMRGIK